MLSLARVVYNRRSGESSGDLRDPAELFVPAMNSQAAVKTYLFDSFIQVTFGSADPDLVRRCWSAKQAEHWLIFLAKHLQNTVKSPNFAWWEISRSRNKPVLGLVVGCASFVMFGLAGWLAGGRLYGTGFGLAYGFSFGLAGALSFGYGSRVRPSRLKFRFRGTEFNFITGLAIGTIAGIGISVAIEQTVDFLASPFIGLSLGAYGLLTVPALTAATPRPSASLRRDRSSTLIFGISIALGLGTLGGLTVAAQSSPYSNNGLSDLASTIIGTAACLIVAAVFSYREYGWIGAVTYGVAGGVVGLLVTTWNPPVSGVGSGLEFGIVFGLAVSLAAIMARAWGDYTICRIYLALNGRLPWRLMSFLDDAHKLGVLRQNGVNYQFRHVELQERLASR